MLQEIFEMIYGIIEILVKKSYLFLIRELPIQNCLYRTIKQILMKNKTKINSNYTGIIILKIILNKTVPFFFQKNIQMKLLKYFLLNELLQNVIYIIKMIQTFPKVNVPFT